MAVSGAVQALIAAFSFGILFNASSASLFLYAIGQGAAIFKDGLRLVLILFLLSSSLWALVEFLATVIDPAASSTCQIAVTFSSAFDQLARVLVEQYLVWALRNNGKSSTFTLLPQIVLFGRFGVGIAFVATARGDFNPTCASVSSVQPIAITTIVVDALLLGLLAIQALSKSNSAAQRGNEVFLVLVGLGVWMGTSVTLLLGVDSIELFFKTTLPAIGLIILVALVAVFSQSLVVARQLPRRPDSPRDVQTDRDLSSSDSNAYPPARYEDVKQVNTMSMSAFANPRDASLDIRRGKNGGIPTISNPVAVGTGVGGLPVQGQLFPPMRTIQADTSGMPGMAPAEPQQIRHMPKPKTPMGKITISHPIVKEEEGVENPLHRIPTTDLATAANNERERRARLAQRKSALIAQRPAPQPPKPQDLDGAKEVAPVDLLRSESNKTTKTAGGLSVEGNASSTGTQLSPGAEAVRRRSPRQTRPAPAEPQFQVIRPGDPVRIPIPRPREPSPPPKIPEPVKTPLQRRPTTGLPRNPRAQAMKATAKEADNQRQQTVMFVNDIVYNDPDVVNDVVQGVSKTPKKSLDSGNSVLHRPRPIPRNSEHDRQVFPAESSPIHGHRRSKSGGSIISRKSILQVMPGSPTQLPPLPPPPKSSGSVARPHPNDTKSMTFDEKMNLFYAGPLSAPSTTTASSQPRKSIPELPSVPSVYMEDMGPTHVEEPAHSPPYGDRRASKTTDRSTLRTASILGVEEMPEQLIQMSRALQPSNAADDLGNSWLPGIPVDGIRKSHSSNGDVNRRSSMVLPPGRRLSASTMRSETRTVDGESTTHWGSVHSPVAPVNMKQSRLDVRSTYIQRDAGRVDASRIASNMSGEVMTVMLDTSSEHSFDNRTSFYFEADEMSTPGLLTPVGIKAGQFHHRVGDECPTFSARKDKTRSRKMPPPTPLLLSGQSTKRTVIVQPAEPSPLESPEVAYQAIQAQLAKYEQPNRDSVESQGKRLALLENLELEMGQLEHKWQSNQSRFERDSMSTVQTTSPARESRPNSVANTLSRQSSQRTIAAERRASRRARMRSASSGRSADDETTASPSSQTSDRIQGGGWQSRLAEAQMEYKEHAPDLIMRKNNLNFLSVSKAVLGSPSPPDTDESDGENDIRRSVQLLSARLFQEMPPVHELWKPNSPVHQITGSWLWTSPAKQPLKSNETLELPGLSVRPASRKASGTLAIESDRLWQQAAKSQSAASPRGLWGQSHSEQPSKSQQRPVTMRPPRRNKRVTLLPDIIENPEPLPDKRGTLGIFQFPWGERSEHATVQFRPNQMLMAMPGTMTTGRPSLQAALDVRARQIAMDEYSSSFFDEYDEEDGDNFDDEFTDSEDGGDDFDENTLWEIASLLKADKVPSKNSLLPLPLQDSQAVDTSVLAEYVSEMPSDEENDDDPSAELEMVPEEPVPVDRPSVPLSKFMPIQPLLWNRTSVKDIDVAVGLPQPDESTWENYVAPAGDSLRSQPHTTGEISPIRSNTLWEPTPDETSILDDEPLWSAKSLVASSFRGELSTQLPAMPKMLWTRTVLPQSTQQDGMFDINIARVDYRRTSKEPAALSMMKVPRKASEPLAQLSTTKLWAGKPQPILRPAHMSGWQTLAKVPKGAVSPAESTLLWEQPVPVVDAENTGLFNVRISRLDYRRTSQEPAAIAMIKTPRKTEEPLPRLVTNNLWVGRPQAVSRPTHMSGWQTVAKAATGAGSEQITLLWDRPLTSKDGESSGLFDVNIFRLDYRRTSQEPAARSMVKAPRKTSEPLPQLSTRSLWSGKPSVVSRLNWLAVPKLINASISRQTTLLWEASPNVPDGKNSGLFNARIPRSDYRRTSQEPAAISISRGPRKSEEVSPSISSNNLWAAETSAPVAPIWLLAPIPMTKPSQAAPAAAVTASAPRPGLTWTKPLVVIDSEQNGLFDVSIPRKDYRRTSQVPAAISMTTKPRKTEESLPIISTKGLWAVTSVPKSSASQFLMWSKPVSQVTQSPVLFQVDPTRKVYRTTSAEPAALQMVRKARTFEEPVKRLESTRLWVSSQSTAVDIDWMTMSSVRPRSPSVGSISSASSAPSSPVTDSSSVKTSTTKASTVSPSTKSSGGLFGGWFGKRSKKQPEVPKVPEHLANQVPDVTEFSAELVIRNLDEVPLPKPVHIPLRKQHRPVVAYIQNWDGALREAIIASYPGTMLAIRASYPQDWEGELQDAIRASHVSPKIVRRKASPREWSNALRQAIMASNPGLRLSRGQILPSHWETEMREAITKSQQSQAPVYNVAVRHPVFFGSLTTTAETIHPALEGYSAPQAPVYNVAVRHPVFFGSLTTTAETIHPALEGYGAPQAPVYNVAVRHPVFFGSLTTTAETIHPALEGYGAPVVRKERSFSRSKHHILNRARSAAPVPPVPNTRQVTAVKPLLWAKPAQTAAKISGGMWCPPVASRTEAAPRSGLGIDIHRDHPRKTTTTVSEMDIAPDFSKQSMWARRGAKASSPHSRDWLEDSMKKRFTRIELRY
ncbi:hypothetical protein F4778DRAFT_532550 [Xylariomycetidae sp. FL2044]|nr:hypothetical protein F4778DRAFT_532550 [Xylariomycetidae sp. FL2044]